MDTITIHCRLLAKEEDLMGYKTLVFRNLDNAPFGQNYCMVTVCPNWQSSIPEINDIGFLTYISVVGGEDDYYDRLNETFVKYNYTNTYFVKFVSEKSKDNSKEIIL